MRDKNKPQRANSKLNVAISRMLRGQTGSGSMIQMAHRLIAAYPHEVISSSAQEHIREALAIDPDNFGASLPIELQHLRQIEGVLRIGPGRVEDNYVIFATNYILANEQRVLSLISLDRHASGFAIGGRAADIQDALLQLPDVDKQSLMVLKLFAAVHSYSDEVIKQFFDANMHSNWIKAALIYPLMYYYSNLPNEASIDKMLLHFVPAKKKGTWKIDRLLMKFFLEPRQDWVGNLALRAYLGMLSHPYDALDYMVSALEIKIAADDQISDEVLNCYSRLAAAFPDHRIAYAYSLAQRQPVGEVSISTELQQSLGSGPGNQLELLSSMFSVEEAHQSTIEPASPLMKSLAETRWSRYPLPADFEELQSFVQRYAVLTAGIIVDALTTGLYLYERKRPADERLHIIRAIISVKGASGFIWLSPGGHSLLESGLITTTKRYGELTAKLSELSDSPTASADRTWIMRANWKAAILQQSGRYDEWAKFAQLTFPIWVHPRYLSGLDWHWLSDLQNAIGLATFRGKPEFIYVLFLRLLERFQRESVSLRIAIEPISRSLSLEAFAEWLSVNYDDKSVALIRLFLSAETILKLRLAQTYTAALTTRIVLLERSVQKFGYVEGVLSEEDLSQEQESLTATLSRMSVGARQFEIPWATLKVDANTRNRDTYSTHLSMRAALSEATTAATTRRVASYPYSNGASIEYEAQNKNWPLLYVVAGIVDTFLTHPSAGVESILSVRIRHDNFRREFANIIASLQSRDIDGIRSTTFRKISTELAHDTYKEVQTWLDARMHTLRKEKPQALFDVIPGKTDMSSLITQVEGLESLDAIIDSVFLWLERRLEDQLVAARLSLVNDLYPAINRRYNGQLGRANNRYSDDERLLVHQAFASAMQRLTNDLQEWFKVPEEDRRNSLLVREVIQAVEQRFWPDIKAGSLAIVRNSDDLDNRAVEPRHIRPLYDLISELARNSLKNSKNGKTKLRLTIKLFNDSYYVLASNLCNPDSERLSTRLKHVDGHTTTSLNDALFAEGKSGLEKIAYLSAYLLGASTQIVVRAQKYGFHLAIPLAAVGKGNLL